MQQSKRERYRFNYLLLVMEGSCFMGGIGFINSSTVIPVFIDTITHSRELVGLTLTLGSFFTYFGRLLIGPYIPKIRNHARFATVGMFLCRPQMLLVCLFIFTHHYFAAVIALIYSYSVLWICDGFVVLPWTEVLANTVDEERHGRLLGTQMLVGGFAAIGAGLMINVFLNNPAIDTMMAFGIIFLLGGVLLTASCFAMSLTANAPTVPKEGKINYFSYYKDLPKLIVSEKDNTRALIMQSITTVAAMGIAFIILFGTDRFGLPKGSASLLILAQSLGTPIGGWLWGQICDRFGCENGMKFAGTNALLISLLPLLCLPTAGHVNPLFFLMPAMFFAGINGGAWSCYYVYNVQVVRPQFRSSCLVLASVFTLPVTFSSYLAGFICDRFGFVALFIVCTVIGALSLVYSFTIRPIGVVQKEREALENPQFSPAKVKAD